MIQYKCDMCANVADGTLPIGWITVLVHDGPTQREGHYCSTHKLVLGPRMSGGAETLEDQGNEP
jgi:hypothetical protein